MLYAELRRYANKGDGFCGKEGEKAASGGTGCLGGNLKGSFSRTFINLYAILVPKFP